MRFRVFVCVRIQIDCEFFFSIPLKPSQSEKEKWFAYLYAIQLLTYTEYDFTGWLVAKCDCECYKNIFDKLLCNYSSFSFFGVRLPFIHAFVQFDLFAIRILFIFLLSRLVRVLSCLVIDSR